MGEKENKQMASSLARRGYAGPRVAKAMEKIDRGLFTPIAHRPLSYVDSPLPIGYGQTITAPSIVAVMTTRLEVEKGMRVLEVGTGSGYQCALLAELVGPKGKVVTVERVPELLEKAREKISSLGYGNVEFVCSDGSAGYSELAPYDRVMVTAAAPRIPLELEKQLKEGGVMVIPVGGRFYQSLIVAKKKGGELVKENVLPVLFVPLIGEDGF